MSLARVENANFLGSVVAPCRMSILSKREKNSTINAAVTKVIAHHNREIDSDEHRVQVYAEENNLIDCIVDSPHIGKTFDIHLTKDGIQIFDKDEDVPVYDHCLTCIMTVGTKIPERDTVFVYCAQLARPTGNSQLAHNFNNTNEMKIPSSTSEQIFVFDFDDPASNSQAHTAVNHFFKVPPLHIPSNDSPENLENNFFFPQTLKYLQNLLRKETR